MSEFDKNPKAEPARPFKAAVEATTSAASQATQAAKQTAENIQSTVQGTVHEMSSKLSEGMSRAGETARELFDFQRGTVEKMLEAGKIYGEGLQSLASHVAAVNREQFEETVNTLRTMASTRSITEAFRLQNELARTLASRSLTEGSKLVHDYLKVTEQAVAPLTTRAQEAAEKLAKAA